MADNTPAPAAGWDAKHIAMVGAGAVAGAVLLPVAVPAALGVLGLGAVLSAAGVTVTTGLGAGIGAWMGHKVGKPS